MKDTLKKIIQEINPEYSAGDGVNLINEGILDSFDIVILVETIEKKYKIKIPGDKIIPENFMTIETLSRLINSLM